MANKKNKVKFGLKNCHYAIATLAEDGTVSFGTPVAMPGAVSLSLDAEGENDPFYADDSVYYMVSNNNGYSGDFELALIPESFLTDVMHETEDANGVIAENKDVEPEHFALLSLTVYITFPPSSIPYAHLPPFSSANTLPRRSTWLFPSSQSIVTLQKGLSSPASAISASVQCSAWISEA